MSPSVGLHYLMQGRGEWAGMHGVQDSGLYPVAEHVYCQEHIKFYPFSVSPWKNRTSVWFWRGSASYLLLSWLSCLRNRSSRRVITRILNSYSLHLDNNYFHGLLSSFLGRRSFRPDRALFLIWRILGFLNVPIAAAANNDAPGRLGWVSVGPSTLMNSVLSGLKTWRFGRRMLGTLFFIYVPSLLQQWNVQRMAHGLAGSTTSTTRTISLHYKTKRIAFFGRIFLISLIFLFLLWMFCVWFL